MRCAGVAECGAWLAAGGLRLDADLALLDAGQWARFPERYYLIDRPDLDLPEFSRQLLDWLPVGRERLLMVSRWSADPPDHQHVFNAIRAGAGADQPLRAAPGHIFAASKEDGADYDERPALDVADGSDAGMDLGGLRDRRGLCRRALAGGRFCPLPGERCAQSCGGAGDDEGVEFEVCGEISVGRAGPLRGVRDFPSR